MELEFNPKVVLDLLVQKSATDRTLAAQIEAAVWQSKYQEEKNLPNPGIPE